MEISRHKAAIRRGEPSLPVKCLLRDGLLDPSFSFFDYGCGHGGDVRGLVRLGFQADGWDPALRPETSRQSADAVNLGYVLNVIEDSQERSETLKEAWKLCRKVLSVAARILVGGRGQNEIEYGDGVLTRIGTFQKFYSQSELREYIQDQLGTDAIPAAPGVFYLFKDEELREQFLATRYRRADGVPRKRASELRFEEHREVLEPLMAWIGESGRLPEPDEFDATKVTAEFGSPKRAFALIRRITGDDEWEATRRRRSEDLLVYMALAKFRRRPRLSQLPVTLQRDIRAFFGTYKKGCEKADALLYRAGDSDAVDQACKASNVGKLLPNALYIHRIALNDLEPLLRVYEGCARSYLGEIEDANVVKLHRFSGKVSYLSYPGFESDPHPALMRSVKLSLRSLELNCWDYLDSDNPPVLHRKEAFLPKEHPLLAKFARLTQQEERHGLLEDTATIGTRTGWQTRLQERGFELRGHRLVKRR